MYHAALVSLSLRLGLTRRGRRGHPPAKVSTAPSATAPVLRPAGAKKGSGLALVPGAIVVAASGLAVVPGATVGTARGFARAPGAIVCTGGGVALVPVAIVVAAGGIVPEAPSDAIVAAAG